MNNIKMKKVLITLDYNPTAEKVAETGYALAKEMKAEVFLLHVISNMEYYTSTVYTPIMGYGDLGTSGLTKVYTAEDLKEETQKYLNKSKEHLGDDKIQTVIAEGESADAILEVASEIKADVIVMGSHSRRWLDKILVGSVTERVLHKSKIPLFIVPTRG
jgi:Universal stress protein UspA and related nucleotide-binding proteins